MKYNPEDYAGKRFGFLTMLSDVPHKDKRNSTVYEFKCDCGRKKLLHLNHVVNGHDISCGCNLGKEYQHRKHVKHGLRSHPLYKTWNNITQRAGKHKNYLNIKVCNEWRSDFVKFYEWAIANGYKRGLTIDRIDWTGDYEPCNCRWISQREQTRNTSRNHFVTIDGETKCLLDWLVQYGSNMGTFHKRVKRGMTEQDAIMRPIDNRFSNKSKRKI